LRVHRLTSTGADGARRVRARRGYVVTRSAITAAGTLFGDARIANRLAATHFLELAVIAVTPALLRTVCHVLATGQEYRKLGPDCYEHRDVDRGRAHVVHALERLGVKVTVEAVA
jgi:hypothetical protein